jgi:transposase
MAERNYEETQFRIGATHGANWLRREARRMAAEGKSSQEISDHLGVLIMVLLDWRNDWNPGLDLPSESNPWDWNKAELEKFIAERKDQW